VNRAQRVPARHGFVLLLRSLSALLLAFLLLPILGLVTDTSASDIRVGLAHPLVAPALLLSMVTSTASVVLVILFGTPLAWLVARSDTRLARFVESAIKLPVVLPPAVAGLGLLLAFGRNGGLGRFLEARGVVVPFTTSAVVLAQLFVSAPFFVEAALAAFRRLDPDLLVIARTLGASPSAVLLRVALPLATPGLASGAALAWARALGEFGATLMFAGSLAGRTQTLPLAIYAALETDLRAARALSLVLVVVAFALLVAVRLAGAREHSERTEHS